MARAHALAMRKAARIHVHESKPRHERVARPTTLIAMDLLYRSAKETHVVTINAGEGIPHPTQNRRARRTLTAQLHRQLATKRLHLQLEDQ